MPAGKQSQSSAMLYTLIAFVAISIIATVCAVYFYVKAEDYKTQVINKEELLSKFANSTEQNQAATRIGKTKQGETYTKTLLGLLDEMVSAVTGAAAEDTPATVKANDAKVKINETLEMLAKDGTVSNTEPVNLVQIIQQLKLQLTLLTRASGSLPSGLRSFRTTLTTPRKRAASRNRS